jgi:hypothetical protein
VVTLPLGTIGDAKVEYVLLTVRTILVKIIERSMVLEGKCREEAEVEKVNCLRSNPLPRDHIYRPRTVPEVCELWLHSKITTSVTCHTPRTVGRNGTVDEYGWKWSSG